MNPSRDVRVFGSVPSMTSRDGQICKVEGRGLSREVGLARLVNNVP